MYISLKLNMLDENQNEILEHYTRIVALDGNIDTSCEKENGAKVWNHIQLFSFSFWALQKCSLYSPVLDSGTY